MATNNCQSCGMPMAKDAQGGGTEADGSKSAKYCSHCFQRGAFTQPNMTAKDMQGFVKKKLVEQKFPGFIAGFMASGIPKLERWRAH
ncbi:MAG: zinc ribbon domain-containing protein [Parvularculaceae bacterium]